MILNQVRRGGWDDLQRRCPLWFTLKAVKLTQRGYTFFVTVATLKGAVDNAALLHRAVVVGHSACDVKAYVEHKEAF
jgi:hypothetical protein